MGWSAFTFLKDTAIVRCLFSEGFSLSISLSLLNKLDFPIMKLYTEDRPTLSFSWFNCVVYIIQFLIFRGQILPGLPTTQRLILCFLPICAWFPLLLQSGSGTSSPSVSDQTTLPFSRVLHFHHFQHHLPTMGHHRIWTTRTEIQTRWSSCRAFGATRFRNSVRQSVRV